jgi:hypothetical protein
MKTRFQVRPAGPRPDFRLVIAFLWGEMHNVDSDGNSDNPASREWTELYLMNRENTSEVVDVFPLETSPLTLAVGSDTEYLAARVAYFLARETRGEVAVEAGPCCSPEDLVSRLGEGFDLAAALRRADGSVWRRSTLTLPYPNLSRRDGPGR